MKAIDYEKHSSLPMTSVWGIWSQVMLADYAKDTCSLIRNSIFAIILFPLWIIPGGIINIISWKKEGGYGIPYWGMVLFNLFMLDLGYVVFRGSYPQAFILTYYLVGMIVTVFVVLFFGGAVAFGEWVEDKKASRYSHPNKSMPVIKTYITNLKKKHCSLIHWVDDK